MFRRTAEFPAPALFSHLALCQLSGVSLVLAAGAAVDRPSRSDCQGTLARTFLAVTATQPLTEDRRRDLGKRRPVRAAIDCNPVSDGAEPPEISWGFQYPWQPRTTSLGAARGGGMVTWSSYKRRACQAIHQRTPAGLRRLQASSSVPHQQESNPGINGPTSRNLKLARGPRRRGRPVWPTTHRQDLQEL